MYVRGSRRRYPRGMYVCVGTIGGRFIDIKVKYTDYIEYNNNNVKVYR